jgi:hypothetical protein
MAFDQKSGNVNIGRSTYSVVRENNFDWLMFIGAQSAFVRHTTRVQACSKDFIACPSIYVFFSGNW